MKKNICRDSSLRSSRSPRILLSDGFPVSRLGIRVLLESELGSCKFSEADTHCHACRILASLTPDLLLLMIDQLTAEALELLSILRQLPTRIPSLAILEKYDPDLAELLLRSGVDGCALQADSPATLVKAVRRLIGGNRYYSRRVRAEVLQETLPPASSCDEHPLQTLSTREVQVFQWIGCGRCTRSIAMRLGLSPKTIESYRENIKHKLDLEDSAALRASAKNWVENAVIERKTRPTTPHANAR